MLNSVGLQNPGMRAWLADELPAAAGHRRPGGGQHLGLQRRRGLPKPAAAIRAARGGGRARRRWCAVEANISLPQHRGPPARMFAHSRAGVRAAIGAAAPRRAARRPAAVGQAQPQRDRPARPGRGRHRRPAPTA